MTLWDQLTDAQRIEIVTEAMRGLVICEVPVHLRDGLLRYLSDGLLPGGLLQAVLCNDLAHAVERAAPGAVFALAPLVAFLRWHVPASAWGSRTAVLAWTTTPDRLEG